MTLTIGGVTIGHGQPCRFVAEISNNHNGAFDRALRLILAAKESGADFVKFQCFAPWELVELRGDGPAPEPWGSQGWTMTTLYHAARTPPEWFADLFDFVRSVGIVPFSSVFGAESLDLLESIGCPAYKLASLDVQQTELLRLVTATGKPVVRSAPTLIPPPGDAVLYCPPGYPQNEINFSAFRSGYTGFSYHGTDPSVPAIAAQFGAKLIEAHFQLDDEPSELESAVSLTASQFREMVDTARVLA